MEEAKGSGGATTLPFQPTYTGNTFYTTRLDTEPPPPPSASPLDPLAGRLAFRDILQPASQLTSLLLTAVKTDPRWLLKAGIASIPLKARLNIITDALELNDNSNDEDEEAERQHATTHGLPTVTRAERALHILSAGRPAGATPPHLHHHKGANPNASMMHAKLSLLRFGKRKGFVRIVVASANLYGQWGQARDVLWVQDFPIDKEAMRRLEDNAHLSTNIDDDGRACAFRQQLAAFCLCMDPDMSTRLFDLLKGVDCRLHKATLIMSLPRASLQKTMPAPPHLNGHLGLRTALSSFEWPEAARDAPITCVTGSLGKVLMEGGRWLGGVYRSMTAGGRHAARPLELGTFTFISVVVGWDGELNMCVLT